MKRRMVGARQLELLALVELHGRTISEKAREQACRLLGELIGDLWGGIREGEEPRQEYRDE